MSNPFGFDRGIVWNFIGHLYDAWQDREKSLGSVAGGSFGCVRAVEDDAGGGFLRTPSAFLDAAQRKPADERYGTSFVNHCGPLHGLAWSAGVSGSSHWARAFEFLTRFSNPVTKFYAHT
jgi:hypothetical protein